MAVATQLNLSSLSTSPLLPDTIINDGYMDNPGSTDDKNPLETNVDMEEAVRLAVLCKQALNTLASQLPTLDPSHAYTPDEILALPLDVFRIDDALHSLPRRKSPRMPLAAAIASLMYPSHDGSLSPLIRYDADRVRLRAWAVLQTKYDMIAATKRNGHTRPGLSTGAAPGVHAPIWSSRILSQGAWDPAKLLVSTEGAKALPMPVQVADGEDLAPFFYHLADGGTHELGADSTGVELDEGKGEPYYHTKAAEFRKGVLYEDGRMDLCKMVVGPDHIGKLMDSLRPNKFVRHFLLGNNIIGPVGANAIADFIKDFPDRMDTWYLAGNCIDGDGFKTIVDALVKSEAVTNVWLKRNPLGPNASLAVYRLISETKNLRTLDLDQTELGDEGVADLFNRLTLYGDMTSKKLPLQHLYLNGVGISKKGAGAIASFLKSPACGLTSIYMSCNPLGDAGLDLIASALHKAPQLTRLSIQSVGVSNSGAIALFKALETHPNISFIDIGQAYATQDLKQAYNYIEDPAVPSLCSFLTANGSLEYLNLGHCPISPPELRNVYAAVNKSKLLFFSASSILPDNEVKTPTFVPSQDTALADAGSLEIATKLAEKATRQHLEANVKAKHGDEMTYARFIDEEKRWLVNDMTDIRKIDSVYRNRDMGLARRHLMTLVKDWDEDDDTIQQVMNAKGPVCTMRRR
jgi:NLR family CARD domain-containing protein 3